MNRRFLCVMPVALVSRQLPDAVRTAGSFYSEAQMRNEDFCGGAVLRFAGRTDVGVARNLNEDRLRIDEAVGVAVVADGVGGEQAGEVASSITVQVVGDAIRRRLLAIAGDYVNSVDIDTEDLTLIVKAAIIDAHAKVLAAAAKNDARTGMASTVVTLFVHGDAAVIGWVGDSPAYVARAGRMGSWLTRSHSVANDLAGISSSPIVAGSKSPLTRVVGGTKDFFVPETVSLSISGGDMFLLCSDGLTDMVSEAEISGLLSSSEKSLDAICRELIEMANHAGGDDNITAVLVRVEKAPSARSRPVAAGSAVSAPALKRGDQPKAGFTKLTAIVSGVSLAAGALLGGAGATHFMPRNQMAKTDLHDKPDFTPRKSTDNRLASAYRRAETARPSQATQPTFASQPLASSPTASEAGAGPGEDVAAQSAEAPPGSSIHKSRAPLDGKGRNELGKARERQSPPRSLQ